MLRCVIFSSMSHQNASVIFREWKHCHLMMHGNGPHDGRKALQLLSKWDLCCLLQLVYMRITRLVMTHYMGPG